MSFSRGRPKAGVTTEDRFWADVKKTDSCWLWVGYSSNGRYGTLSVERKRLGAHIYSYMLHHGLYERPKLKVCHRCDVPLCVNPAHLFLGTHQENMLDASRKGRLCTKEKGNTGAQRVIAKRGVGPGFGVHTIPSEETREKLRLVSTGRKLSENAKEKLRTLMLSRARNEKGQLVKLTLGSLK